jgi:hypothetical protein
VSRGRILGRSPDRFPPCYSLLRFLLLQTRATSYSFYSSASVPCKGERRNTVPPSLWFVGTPCVWRGRGPGAVLVAAADLWGEIGFTIGGGVVAATYSNVSVLWSLSNTCVCRGWMDSWNFLRKSRPKMGVATLASKNSCVNDLFPKTKVRF